MGCLLAERQSTRIRTPGHVWLWRVAVFFASVATLELRFHTPVHFDLSLNFFGILVFYWLSRELDYCQTISPWSWLERAGAWSYSLYVMHPAAGQVTAKLFPSWPSGMQWLVRIPVTLGVCYLFYLAVEKPSHRLARVVGRALRPSVELSVPPLA
jgi:peptidoglycan/LPS O-acetylase OafA/YrhL